MGLFDWLNSIDTQLLLSLHGEHNAFWDAFFTFVTRPETWVPLYLLFVVIILRKYRPKGFWVLLIFILAIAASDQFSGLLKEWIQRPRPSHAPGLLGKLHLPTGGGGAYGFVSAHAANAFALTILLGLIAQSRRLWIALTLWAILVSYSRIYVGVHYPFDVICGGIIGAFIGLGAYVLLRIMDRKMLRKRMHYAGRWKTNELNAIVLALCFIVVTLLIVAYIVGKYYVHIA